MPEGRIEIESLRPLGSGPFENLTSGQSNKHFTLVNYNSRVVMTRKLPILRLYSRKLRD